MAYAKYEKKPDKSDSSDSNTDDKAYRLGQEFKQSYDALREDRETWDYKETLLLGKLNDQYSNTRKSQVTDGSLSTMQWERSARVMAQSPTGKVQALTAKDKGKNALMNIALNRYIIPNANAQYPHVIKNRLIDVYSRAWGACPVLWDYRVDDDYIGPDSWIINIRDFFPQPNKLTIQECDWVMVSTTVSVGWLKTRKGKGWDDEAIDKVIEKAKDGTTPTKKTDLERIGSNSPNLHNEQTQKGDYAEVELMTKYGRGKKGRWVTFAPDFDNCILKDIPNPHETGKIPIGLKQNFPRIDSIIGMSDIERGMTLQRAKDSLINLYLDGVKMSIFPPLKINPQGVTMTSIRNAPAAKWLMDDPNKVQQLTVSPSGMNTFVSTYQFLHGALLSQMGTTDTRVSGENTASDMGKTPAAIKQNMSRENARDNWDRFMMERFLEEQYEYFINLMAIKQEKPVPIDIFEEEIRQLEVAGMEDVAEIRDSGTSGTITLNKSAIKGKYRYYIDQGTTMAKEDGEELQALVDLSQIVLNPAILQLLQQTGTELDVSEYIKRMFIKAGIQDWEKIVKTMEVDPTQDPTQDPLQNPSQDAQQAIDPMTGQMIQQVPQVDPQQLMGALDAQDQQIAQLVQASLGQG